MGLEQGSRAAGGIGSRRLVVVTLAAIIAGGAFFRLAYLGMSALRADTITFWNICGRPITLGAIFGDWLKLMGVTGQFPFPMAFTKWFLDVFHLPLTFFTLRLPSALWGILTVGLAFGLGRALAGVKAGLLLALLTALNPLHIQISREAYYYAPLVAGAYLSTWALVLAFDHYRRGKPLPASFQVINGVGFFLLTYSQPTGWSLALLTTVGIVIFLGLADRKAGKLTSGTVIALVVFGVLGVPLLTCGWALKHLIMNATGPAKEAALKALAVQHGGVGVLTWRLVTSFAWGSTLPGAVVSLAAVGLGLAAVGRQRRTNPHLVLLPILLAVGFGLYLLFRGSTGATYSARYLAALLPVYLSVLSLGLIEAGRLGPRLRAGGAMVSAGGVIAALAVGWLVYPGWLCVRLTGKPTPYKEIVRWMDTHMPAGSLVLVDRWYEPWNELRVHASTNVFFTFTVPNEPVDVFLKADWRKTAREFFARFPRAGYLEITKEYWDVPEVGPWDWPRRYFKRHVVFANRAGLALRRLGLASREDFYAADTNRLVVEFFYNRLEDILAKAREAGLKELVLYGDGWKYTKTKDYHDWRVFEQHADLLVFNLSDGPRTLFLELRGAAMGGAKDISGPGGIKHTFPAGKMEVWRVGPFRARPGESVLTLRDPLWTLGKVPLLVDGVRVGTVTSAGGQSPSGGGE